MADLHAAAGRRTQAYARFDRIALALPPGRVQELWDDDVLTVSETLRAWRVREERGLAR